MTLSNNPPPVEAHGMTIEDLFDEAKNFLDGEPVTTDEQATAIGNLLIQLRQARKAADEQRKVEKKPHDDAAKAVQAAWVPLIAKCDLASATCDKALVPFQTAKEARQREEAAAARKVAEDARIAALAAHEAANPEDLTQRADAEQLLKDAKRADADANRLERQRPQVVTDGRAIGLRSSFRAEITDQTAFARWAWANRRDECEAFFSELAQREGRRGPVEIPGIIIHTERKAA
jgi:hypothetical protein